MDFNRRQLLAGILVIPITAAMPATAASGRPTISVAKTATCGCCQIWVDYLVKEGFKVETRDMAAGALTQFKIRHGITPNLASCHTARVGGYTIEGHVPVREINRLLAEKPAAIGLTVPGMPLGSPGMDQGPEKEPYDVLLIRTDGSTEVFARYGGQG